MRASIFKSGKSSFYAKTLSYSLFGITMLHAASSYAAVSQSPLSLTVGVPPNMLLTLDDSGSMRWGFSPDSLSGDSSSRRTKASAYNAIYYNPSVKYQVPIVFDTSGNEQQLSTSFTQAWHNGYRTSVGSTNLSGANYRVAWDVPVATAPGSNSYGYGNTTNYAQPTGTVYRIADNPAADFQAQANMTSNGTRVVTTSAGIIFTITRSSSSSWVGTTISCTATASFPSLAGTISAPCSVSANGGTQTASLAQTPVLPYYYIYDATKAANCSTNNDNCYTLSFVSSSEQQNFANWYSFYRNRALSTVSAAAIAFYDLSSAVRLSWQGLGRCTTFDGSDTTYCKNNAFKAYTPTHKGQLYAWLQNIAFDQSTYLPAAMKRAGEFYKTSTAAWQAYPNGTGNTAQNTYACRASYHIMMTDGQWNEATTAPGSFRSDESDFKLPDGTTYTKSAPYYDKTQNTLADLAMHYWATDLNTSLANSLTAYSAVNTGNPSTDYWNPRNDPATWQHMTNFTMGLGLTQSLTLDGILWDGSTFAGSGYETLRSGSKAWPAAAPNADANVYDLWHAAINSRGEFFSVESPQAMVQAFTDILSRIADRKSTASRPTTNSGQVTSDENGDKVVTVSYQTSFASDDNWSGDLKRYEKSWNTKTQTYETTQAWSAKTKIPAAGNRKIKIAGTGNSGLVELSSTTAALASYSGTTLLTYLSRDPENSNATDLKAAARLAYLRGDRTGEGTTFRTRSGLLGDFYSSAPAVVSNTPRYLEQFSNRLEGNTAYSTFKTSISQRTPRLYVGGNDGMLHGFNAETGVEEFAFIPSAVFPKLNKLTGSNYSHEFYVEGSPVVADVYDSSSSQWRTILVGTLKGGGKSIFALDITTPGSEKLLWQFDDSSIPAANTVKMGYSFSQPTVARLHSGKWAVVFGNGYESSGNSNGKAALFIVDAMQGTLLKSLEVQGTNAIANGLSTPKIGDFNADGVADYAYAGDLQGNLWRFDLLRSGRDSTRPFITTDDGTSAISDFKVGFGGNPLFRATADNAGTQRQAITSPPSLIAHPTGTGYLIVFGTGRFFDADDKDGDKSMSQSVYGIWDKQTLGEIASNPNISRSTLQQQTVGSTTTVTSSGSSVQGRVVSNNSIRWQTSSAGAAQNGWYLNLVKTDGEMVVENMSQLGRMIVFQTLVPNSDPCGDGTTTWTYALNPYTGGRTAHNAFDYTSSDGIGASVILQPGEGGVTISQNSGSGSSGYEVCTGQKCETIYPDPTSIGRQSWRRTEEKE